MTEIDLAKVGHQFALDGTAERAANQKAYLKSELDFFRDFCPNCSRSPEAGDESEPDHRGSRIAEEVA